MTYPLATLSPIIDGNGITAPPYLDIYESLKESFRIIYGADIYIEDDSQDGQWIAIIAKAIHDSNQAGIAIFQSFSPTYAQGIGLSSVVKINGIKRNSSGYSSAVGDVIGVAGTVITGGVVRSADGTKWSLPASVTIPIGGSISVTVTAQTPGDIAASIGTINVIDNPQLGWQSFSNTAIATQGAAIETDAQLKLRQSISTALPAQTVLDGILASVGNVTGVTRFAGYENDTGSTDVDGIPAHSIAIITQGGSVSDIAYAIALKKMPGAQTYGSISYTVIDPIGIPSTIHFSALTIVDIYFEITIKALTGYTSAIGADIKSALMNYIDSLAIGEDVYNSQAIAASSLISIGNGHTFYIVSLKQGTAPAPTLSNNITIAYGEAANCDLSSINLIVT